MFSKKKTVNLLMNAYFFFILENTDLDESLGAKNETFDKASIIMTDEDDDKKVFYLFTRTAREKEEWFNHFMVAAKFMEDWEHQNPKEGASYDPNYETFKVNYEI